MSKSPASAFDQPATSLTAATSVQAVAGHWQQPAPSPAKLVSVPRKRSLLGKSVLAGHDSSPPNKQEALSSNPSTAKEKDGKKIKTKQCAIFHSVCLLNFHVCKKCTVIPVSLTADMCLLVRFQNFKKNTGRDYWLSIEKR
jgi:hypothetical protein